ncbi:MAG TPA: carbohydrate-binding family 9-like protein [Bacteroidales bacterium]|nr:carbohydrate-binding family 9-like protein [Bacteroidales bacterium]
MMKVAKAKKAALSSEYPSLEELSALLDTQTHYSINTLNWKDFSYKPEVKFAIAYSDHEIFLKYYVREEFFKAEKTITNEMVCEDSCVEFFVSPEYDGLYYNIEFNAIGTCLLGTGHGRSDSERADPLVISKIRRLASAGVKPVKEKQGDFNWSLTIAIPLEVFFRHNIKELTGKTFMANFYKCGDKLKMPHYVTWNPIGTEKPDYHRPEYFGAVKFI